MWEYVITNGKPGVMLEHGISAAWALESFIYDCGDRFPDEYEILLSPRSDVDQKPVVFHGGVIENGETWSAFI